LQARQPVNLDVREEMNIVEIKIAGIGDQGIVKAGYIIGQAASLYDNMKAVLTQSYVPESRGGRCSTEIIISDEEIDYPFVQNPDILICMSRDAYLLFSPQIKKDGTIIIDEDMVDPGRTKKKKSILKIPATRMAENLGKKIIANIIMLGFFTSTTKAVSEDAMEKSILSLFPGGMEDLNLKAFREGIMAGKRALKKGASAD